MLAHDPPWLEREVDLFHRHLFGAAPSPWLRGHYLAFHQEVKWLAEFDEPQARTLQVVVTRGLNAVGVEFWLRDPRVPHLLTVKLTLLSYLAECEQGHPQFGRKVTLGLPRALWRLGVESLKGAGLLMIGYVQRRRYGLF
jgi:hypothetical protein